MSLLSSRRALLLGAALALSSPMAGAQTISGFSLYRSDGFATNTVSGANVSKTFVTQGTNPTTDAFLELGNTSTVFNFPSVNLAQGTNTFYLWACCSTYPTGSQPTLVMNVFGTGSTTVPILSAGVSSSANTINVAGTTSQANVNSFGGALAVGLSAVLGGNTVTITDFSIQSVTRNVSLSNYVAQENVLFGAATYGVGRLVITVTPPAPPPQPPTTAVPEPSTWVLMTAGLAGMFVVARRRRTVNA